MKLLAISIATAILALDFLTKWWVKETHWLHYYEVIEGFFTIHYIRNEGIAFGLFHSNQSEWKPLILSAMALGAVVIVLYYIWTSTAEEKGIQLLLGLLLGGILGNFFDRILRGYVVDFLKLHWQDQFAWPTFNVADAAISCGVAAILYQGFFGEPSGRKASRHRDRNSSRPVSIFLLIGSLVVPQLSGSDPRDASEIAKKIQDRYEEIQSFSADFKQVFRGPNFELTEWGILLMKRPGKMYWEYHRPNQKFFVADGKKCFFYVPRDNQVMISDLDLETADTPLLFLIGHGNIQKDFQVQFERDESPLKEENVILRMTPHLSQPEFTHLIVEISTSNYLIRRLIVFEPIGNRNDYIFTRFRENVKIHDKQFQLTIPKGVDIIHQSLGLGTKHGAPPWDNSYWLSLGSVAHNPGKASVTNQGRVSIDTERVTT